MLPYKGCLLGSPPGRLRTIRYSNVHRTFELRSCPHGFESLLFSYETNRHPPLFIGVPEKRELFGEKEQQRSA